MTERVGNLLMVVAVLCAVTVTAAVVRREMFSQPLDGSTDGDRVPNWQEYTQSPNVTGPADAEVVLVEFFDFQCPACRRLSLSLDSILARGTPSVRVVRRHYPLSNIHPHARELAIVGECVRRQGAFEAYYLNVFAAQALIGTAEWVGPMSLVPPGIDTATVRRCVTEGEGAAVVEFDIAAGDRLGIRGTPTFIINGRRFDGWRSVSSLDSLFDRVR